MSMLRKDNDYANSSSPAKGPEFDCCHGARAQAIVLLEHPSSTPPAQSTEGTGMDPLDDIVKEFLIESLENLDRLDQDLLALEGVPDDRGRLSSVFRAIHTIKGTSGFLAFGKLEHIT